MQKIALVFPLCAALMWVMLPSITPPPLLQGFTLTRHKNRKPESPPAGMFVHSLAYKGTRRGLKPGHLVCHISMDGFHLHPWKAIWLRWSRRQLPNTGESVIGGYASTTAPAAIVWLLNWSDDWGYSEDKDERVSAWWKIWIRLWLMKTSQSC